MRDNFHNKQIGKYGEDLACKYLEKIGYNIISRNFYTSNSEIDIVAQNKEEIIFVEVKSRMSKKYGNPIESVDNYKQKHILDASKYFIYKNKLENQNIRFDIIEVYINDKGNFINHIKNVFF